MYNTKLCRRGRVGYMHNKGSVANQCILQFTGNMLPIISLGYYPRCLFSQTRADKCTDIMALPVIESGTSWLIVKHHVYQFTKSMTIICMSIKIFWHLSILKPNVFDHWSQTPAFFGQDPALHSHTEACVDIWYSALGDYLQFQYHYFADISKSVACYCWYSTQYTS